MSGVTLTPPKKDSIKAKTAVAQPWRKKREKTPTVLQMEAVECGAAALGIILAYYGRFVPLEELRIACGVSRDGSKASNIVRAARKYGLKATGFKAELPQLVKFNLPLIIHWRFSHFLVLEGFNKDKVYLNDPAGGPRTVTRQEFDDNFTGVVLEFAPTAEFAKGGKQFNTLAALVERLRSSKTALLFVTLVGLSLVLPGLVLPSFIRAFVDYYLVRDLDSWILPILSGMGLAAALRGLLTWLREHYLLRLETKLAISMSGKFFWHVLRLPVEFYTQRYAGEIGNRVAINEQVAYLISGRLASTLLDLTTIVFFSVLMFLYDPLLTVIGITFAFGNLAALRYVARKRVDTNQKLANARGKLAGMMAGGLQHIESIKAAGRESDFFARMAGQNAEVVRDEERMDSYSSGLGVVPPLLMALTTALILTIGGLRVMDGQITIGMLVAFQSLMISFMEPVNKLVDLGAVIQEVEGGLKRLDDVLKAQVEESLLVEEALQDISKRMPKLSGRLELSNITFGYSRLEPPLIQNFNLTLEPGKRVALVGGSGSGKSTVAKLVSGLYEPWEGGILFDGKPRTQLPRTTLTNSMGVVDQDIFLFEGTVRDNLTLWEPTIPETRVVKAAQDACIHDEIASRVGGYGSLVAENGSNYSGGQRQRLEIARALTSDPVLLVLDEATSALDPLTEKLIDTRLRRRGCTCLIIAHRLSTIRDCDEIIVLEKGQIVQRGTHQEMLQSPDSPYARLIAS